MIQIASKLVFSSSQIESLIFVNFKKLYFVDTLREWTILCAEVNFYTIFHKYTNLLPLLLLNVLSFDRFWKINEFAMIILIILEESQTKKLADKS